jgi:parallel beta-helix repeat protein
MEVTMRTCLFLLTVFFLAIFTSTTQAVTVHVPDDFDTIQEAIDACVDGDTVIVRDGTYTGEGNREIDFTGKALVVMSENGPEVTIIDCEGSPGDYHLGFFFNSGEGPGSVVQGFTIQNGYVNSNGGGIYCYNSSPTITGNIITDNSAYINGGVCNGGGIYCYNSSATITGNIITANLASEEGGGIYCALGSPIISDNTISLNSADNFYSYGGGISCFNSSPVITDNVISDNFASTNGGGIYGYYSNPTITDNTISGNMSGGWAGGIGIWWPGTDITIITGNTITGNSAAAEGGGIGVDRQTAVIEDNIVSGNTAGNFGAGLEITRGIFTVSNNVITNNAVNSFGGGIVVALSYATMNNNTIVENYANDGGGIMVGDSSTVNITNTISWNNDATTGDEIWIGGIYSPIIPSTLTISYSDVEGGKEAVFIDKGCTLNWGLGMIDEDPRFMSFHGFDYLLRRFSPCIDTGDPALDDGIEWPKGYFNGPRSDMGAYGGPGNVNWLP